MVVILFQLCYTFKGFGGCKIMMEEKNLFQLSWPIFIEILLFMLMGVCDTLMLSNYSDSAVAAVGTSNQLLGMFRILINIVSTGVIILISQSIGRENKREATEYSFAGLIANATMGVVLASFIIIFRVSILKLMNTPASIIDIAAKYTFVVGLSIVFMAIASTNSAIIRSNGFTKITMVIAFIANITNVTGNYILIYGKLGFPELGALGTSITTSLSSVGIVIAGFIFIKKKVELEFDVGMLKTLKNRVFDIVKIGLPRALEQFSFSLSQTVIFSFIAALGEYAITTKVYVQQISWFVMLTAIAIAQGNQILIGYFVGAKDYRGASKRGLKSNYIAMIVSTSLSIVFALNGEFFLSFLTDNQEIIELGKKLLWVGVFIEPFRAVNLVIIHALGAGSDVIFPMVIAIISMWGISVGVSFASYSLGFGLVGIFFANGLDEFVRSIAVMYRWKSNKWVNKTINN